jgi:hypothetical protein
MADVRTHSDFTRDLAAGQQYEDFVQRVLWQHGYIFVLHRSAKYQWSHGESVGGIEIKLDRNCSRTGNLYIETEERRTTDGLSSWRPSGIHDEPRPSLYAIGDYTVVYLLSVNWLLGVEPFHDRHTGPTMKGFLLRVDKARLWAVQVIDLPAVDDEAAP